MVRDDEGQSKRSWRIPETNTHVAFGSHTLFYRGQPSAATQLNEYKTRRHVHVRASSVVEERRASSPQGLGLALRDLLELADRQLVEAADPHVRVGEVASQPVLARPGVAHHGDHLRGGEGGGGGEGGAALLMRGVGRPLR